MERKLNNAEIDCFVSLVVMVVCCGVIVAGCNDDGGGTHESDNVYMRYGTVSTQGFAAVEKAMPKIREMMLSDTPSDFREITKVYAQIDAVSSLQERYSSYRFLLDSLMSSEAMNNVPRDRLRGLLSGVSADVFVKFHEMNAPVKEKAHAWLAYIRKMDAEALWVKEEFRKSRVEFVEKFINDMLRLGYLNDATERSEIEAEFLSVIGRPLKHK